MRKNRSPEAGLPSNCPDYDNGMSGDCTPNVDWVTNDSIAFSYDDVGNRTDQGGSYTTGNRITAFAGCTYNTDAAGNVVSRKGTTPCVQIDTLLWTPEGWLDSIKIGTTGIKFLYDADGRLTAKRVNGALALVPVTVIGIAGSIALAVPLFSMINCTNRVPLYGPVEVELTVCCVGALPS